VKVRIAAVLLALTAGCGGGGPGDVDGGGDGGGGRPTCDELADVCHVSISELGMQCDQLGHDVFSTEAQCMAMRDECVAECTALANTLFVAREDTLVSFDIARAEQRPGTVTNVTGPAGLQVLGDGIVGLHSTGRNEVVFVDAATMAEVARRPSSMAAGVRPVLSYISPLYGADQYWLTLNDGTNGTGDSATFFQIGADSGAARFTQVGEVALGNGHHVAAFHATLPRVVIGNLDDCGDVLSVFEFSDLGDIQKIATLTGAQAGFDHADPGADNFDPLFCDPSRVRGLPPAPQGCVFASESGKVYCNLSSSGAMAVVNVAADPPTFTRLNTAGNGGGESRVHDDGRHVYTLQHYPREGFAGVQCQIGRLVVTDALTDSITSQLSLRYTGPECTDQLIGTAAETANADNLVVSGAGRLFIGLAGGLAEPGARVDQRLVVDVSQRAFPTQDPSIQVGVSTGASGDNISGDLGLYFALDRVDGTASQINTQTLEVTATIDVGADAVAVACYGPVEGPSPQR
jgi:hypothetical protein